MGFRDVPAGWAGQLSAFGKPNDQLSWLELVFHPWWERWVIYQCIPAWATNGFVLLAPASGTPLLNLEQQMLDPVQWHIYQTKGIFASPYWVIQGNQGGHRRRLWPYEIAIAEVSGLVGKVPDPGSLPYANFDQRVMERLAEADLVAGYQKVLEYTDRHEGRLDREEEAAKRELKRKLFSWVQHQTQQHFETTSKKEWAEMTDALPHGRERRGVRGMDLSEHVEQKIMAGND
jgi:hypothetical protein